MSGECEKCGEHTLECVCKELMRPPIRSLSQQNSYFPPPWPMTEENKDKTAGWLDFQDSLADNPEYYGLGVKWISVEDKLPEVEYHVLLYDTYEKICVGYLREDDWMHHPVGDYATGASLYGVTHWMPLPELPNLCNKCKNQTYEFEGVNYCDKCLEKGK